MTTQGKQPVNGLQEIAKLCRAWDENWPGWELTFLCNGQTFKFLGRARTVQEATTEARLRLSAQHHEFSPQNARLVSAVQVL